MGRRNVRLEELRRLESKTQDAQFVREIREGLNCSPFEAEAVLGVVREVFGTSGEDSTAVLPPGRVTLVAVDADEPAGKPVADCQKRTVCLTVHRGAEDDRLLRDGGARAFRQARIAALCQEALSQGVLLTREDLAYRVFFVSPSTITRDLRALREQAPTAVVPLRSTIQDIGPLLTHRVEIVRLALEGKTTTQICAITRHSPAAVANYVSTFTRVAQLAAQDLEVGQIAFLLRRGRSLIERYMQLLKECASDRNQRYHLEELLRIGGGKKAREEGGTMGRRPDYVRKKFAPMLDKTLENAVAHRIGQEFPRIGGPRIRALCAEMVLDVVQAHLRPREHVRHGQVVWMAVDVNDPPSRNKTIADTSLVPVVLDLSTPDDIEARIQRHGKMKRLEKKLVRACRQAHAQNALLSNSDLAELFHLSDSYVSVILTGYEERTGEVVPRRANLHDMGSGLTHKRIICRKRYLEGKTTEQIARETYHSLDSVDGYLGQYDRVRCCRQEGMDTAQIAYTLRCSPGLVEEYLALDRKLEGKND